MREELLANLRGDEVVLGEQPPVVVLTVVRRVELQKPADEAEVVGEALVREAVEAEVEVRLEVRGVRAPLRADEFFEVALGPKESVPLFAV